MLQMQWLACVAKIRNSGLSVEDPNKKKKPQGGDSDGPNELVKNLLKKAAE